MSRTLKFTDEEAAVLHAKAAADRLRHPRPGSRIAAAQEHGVDLSLLIENLQLTPAERVKRMHDVIVTMEQVRGVARPRPE